MASGRNGTLIKKLMDNKFLNCQSCKKLLNIPVFLVDGVGNVCQSCTSKNDWKGVQNGMFEVLLQELTIPCKNAVLGCIEEVPSGLFEEHLKTCKHRHVQCPHLGCKSMVSLQDNFSYHFLENHRGSVIESDTFNFLLDSEEPTNYFAKILIKRNLKFLFVLKQDKEADELVCTLFKCHNKNPLNLTTISFSNGDKENSFSIVINSLNSIGQDCTVEKKICLSILRSMFHEGELLSLKVALPPNDYTLQMLECPICMETMRPPIYLCEKGHTICNNCCKKIQTCPSCTGAISKTVRNYCLESATHDVFYSCAYKRSGCTTVLSGDLIMDHETKCVYHSHKCPFCKFHYNLKNVSNHVRYKHKNVTNYFEFEMQGHGYYFFEKGLTKSMYVDGCFFHVSYECDAQLLARIYPRFHQMKYVYLMFQMLNYDDKERMLKNLNCKITIKNKVTQAEITQIQLLNGAEKNNVDDDHFWIFVPIEALSDSVDVSRKASYLFRCELLMK